MKEHYKYLIVGAGGAGLQMGYFLNKAGLDYIILEKNETAGSFFRTHPVHGRLISINKKHNFFEEEEFNMRHDWNSLISEEEEKLKFTSYSDELYPDARILAQYYQDFANHHKLNVQYNTSAKHITKNSEGLFAITLNNENTVTAQVLLIATGALRQHMPKEIEGIENTISYSDFNIDKNLYINKRVGILGGGNSAFEVAESIQDVVAFIHLFVRKRPKMSYETHFVGDVRAKYTNIFDMFHLKSMYGVLDPRLKKITKLENGCLETQHEYDYPDSSIPGTLKLTREYDYIINCSGFRYTHLNLFDQSIQPETAMNDKFYSLTEQWESTNISNLFFIGTLMQSIDRKSASGFIHGFRYNIRSLSKLLQQRYEDKPYPKEIITINHLPNLLKKIYERFSIGDGIYQLYSLLGDKLVFNEQEKNIEWYKEMPIKYIQKEINPNKHTFILSLDFGFNHYPGLTSLDFMRPSDPNNTEKAAFLHPIVTHHYQSTSTEFHFGDSLLGRWDMPHETGGAVASYHTEFYNWMAGILGLEQKEVSEMIDNPNYVKFEA